MKLGINILRIFTIVFFLAFIFTKPAIADGFSLQGTIKNGSGAAIGEATITVTNTDSGATLGTATSESSTGNYSMSSIPAGTYKVQVVPLADSGYQSSVTNVTISSDTTQNFVLVPGQPLITISGRITAGGNPVSGITVGSVTTDSNGNYSFTQAPGFVGLYLNNAQSNTSLPIRFSLGIEYPSLNAVSDKTIDVQIPVNTVTVQVQDVNNNGLTNAGVTFYPPGGNGSGNTVPVSVSTSLGTVNSEITTSGAYRSGTTGSGGTFVTPIISGGPYQINVTPPNSNYLSSITSLTVSSNQTHTVTLQPKPQITISGHITANGQPVSGITVGNVVTDSNGFYSFTQDPGFVGLYLNNSQSNTSLPIRFALGIEYPNMNITTNTTIDVQIPVNTVTFNVMDANSQAVANAGVTVYPPGGNGSGNSVPVSVSTSLGTVNSAITTSGAYRSGSTGSNGTFVTPLITGGPYQINVTPPDNNYQASVTTLNVSSNMTAPITLQPQPQITISGHITAGGQPVSGITVGNVVTNSSGFYSFTQAPGFVGLYLNNSQSNTSLPIKFALGIEYPNLNIIRNTTIDVQIPVNTFTVKVQDSFDNAIANAGVTVYPPGGNGSGNTVPVSVATTLGSVNSEITTSGAYLSGATGSNGIFVTPLISGGPYQINLTPPNSSYSQSISPLTINSNLTQTYVLQYSHASPVTTANLETHYSDDTYSNPTSVTLSASAAAGYSVANTYYTVDGGSQQTYTTPFTVNGNGSHTITYWSVDNSGVPESQKTKTFTIAARYNLTGTVYVDANQNGLQDTGEIGYAGASLSLDSGQTATTDSNGNYSFTSIVNGSYVETLTLPSGYTATTTNPATVALNANTTQNFGIFSGPTFVTAINTGGSGAGDFNADTSYSGGSTYSSSDTVSTTGVTNPAPQDVYKTVRYGNFTYTISNLTPNSSYGVRLHFNELYWNSIGARVFDVKYNGQTVLDNYDIFEAAGGKNKAVVAEVNGTADSNGTVTLQFMTEFDNAMVNGIEVYSGTLDVPSPTPTPTLSVPYGINTGGSTVGDYVADRNFSGGSLYTTTNSVNTSGVTDPAPEAVYKSVRYGNFTYTLPNLTPSTNYVLRLHFNELYWNSAGSRVFDVAVNGTQVINDYDIYQIAGGKNRAVVEEIPVTANSNGTLQVQFSTVVDNAMINGIEVVSE